VIPTVTVDQMREVDRLMVEEMGIELLQMMENAGRALAAQARRLLGGDARGRRVVVLVGRGGNGGGGLAAARRLHTWGADVSVVLAQPAESMAGVPAHQLAILDRIGVGRRGPEDASGLGRTLAEAELVLDALIGYSLRGPPREPVASLIRAANGAATPILALDVPSGLDGDTGEAHDPTIRAAATLTLALPKAGLLRPAADGWVGELRVADISVPAVVYRRLGIAVEPLFGRSDVVPVARRRSRGRRGRHGAATVMPATDAAGHRV
jgi:NAD(P)H-hydrate epimerase